jgi:hypothetical protein
MPFHRIVVPTAILGLLLASNVFAPPPAKEEKATPPWELARAKVDAARRTCLAIAQEYLEGRASAEQVNQWSQRWLNAEREVSSKKADQLEALRTHVSRMQQLEKAAQDRLRVGKGLPSDISAAEYHRVDAELAYSRAKSSR